MLQNTKIREFFERAKAQGISDQVLIRMLLSRGWPEKEINGALADYYEHITETNIPLFGVDSGTAAKEAFHYLLIFATLATWTTGLGCLSFALIDQWLGDPLFTPNLAYGSYSITAAVASLLVAFPIYLLVSRAAIQQEISHPEKPASSVRRWLTYMALVIAACIFMGDLIVSLTYLLRGEVTTRFLSKALVVLTISGGVFFHYYGGIQRTGLREFQKKINRNSMMAGLSVTIVALVVFLGFWQIGGPGTQRRARADEKRVEDLSRINRQIGTYWHSSHRLPEVLNNLTPNPPSDPMTGASYEYLISQGSRYSLCATFAQTGQDNSSSHQWSHPAGRHCFPLDAAQTTTRYSPPVD